MRKFKYVHSGKGVYDLLLTTGKTYDVIEYVSDHDYVDDYIKIIDDYGNEDIFFINADYYTPFFVEVTNEYRNEIIDGILI